MLLLRADQHPFWRAVNSQLRVQCSFVTNQQQLQALQRTQSDLEIRHTAAYSMLRQYVPSHAQNGDLLIHAARRLPLELGLSVSSVSELRGGA